jgi:hypothetical protein
LKQTRRSEAGLRPPCYLAGRRLACWAGAERRALPACLLTYLCGGAPWKYPWRTKRLRKTRKKKARPVQGVEMIPVFCFARRLLSTYQVARCDDSGGGGGWVDIPFTLSLFYLIPHTPYLPYL